MSVNDFTSWDSSQWRKNDVTVLTPALHTPQTYLLLEVWPPCPDFSRLVRAPPVLPCGAVGKDSSIFSDMTSVDGTWKQLEKNNASANP